MKPVDVVFFDLRDTLGEVDRPGHFVPYRPSTEKLLDAMRQVVGLRIGVITNLPTDVTAEQGRTMIAEALLSDKSRRTRLLPDRGERVRVHEPDGHQHPALIMDRRAIAVSEMSRVFP